MQYAFDRAKADALRMLEQALPRTRVSSDEFTLPPSRALGDLAFPCFKAAADAGKKPGEFAVELRAKLTPSGFVTRVEVAGPYLNFFFNREQFSDAVLRAVLQHGKRYGRAGKTSDRILVEYVSPNTNKPLHLGHVRNAALGGSLCDLLEAGGARVIRALLLNDRGTTVAKSTLAYLRWGDGKTPKSEGVKGDHFVLKFYVLYEQKVKDDPTLEAEMRALLQKWEVGDRGTRALVARMNRWVEAGHEKTYRALGVRFDRRYRESEIYEKGKELVMDGLARGVFIRDETGAIIAPLEPHGLPNKVLLRADGTAIYATADLYLAKHRFETERLTKSVYCVGSEQVLYFKQLFKIFELLGFPWAKNCTHRSYGLIFLPEGKMKSREGTVVDADLMLAKLEEYAAEEIKARHDHLSAREVRARTRAVALAALKFYILEVTPESDMHFDPRASLSFTGRTGPYLQYTYARVSSILRKAGRIPRHANVALLREDAEYELALILAQYPDVIRASAAALDPSLLARFLYTVAQGLNDFYRDIPVLKAEADLRAARLRLVSAARSVLASGLALLGIPVLEEM
ncbi:MAG: arginine--tRNA ligase [Patescibacteria group bacterium]